MHARRLTAEVSAALADTPVVFLAGPRQAGKSTLVRALCDGAPTRRYLTFDDARTRAAAAEDPEGFLAGLIGPVALDEVQRVPTLFPALKGAVDRDRHPGRFLLTGSADVLLVPALARELVGRMEVLTLWPLSQGELAGAEENVVDALFADAAPAVEASAEDRRGLVRRLVRGGFPEAAGRATADRRARWFEAYAETLLGREIRELAAIERTAALPRLLALLAARSASLANQSELSRASGLPLATMRRYLALFETLFLVQTVPAWAGSLARRLVRAPKLVVTDSGLCCHLRGLDEEGLLARPEDLGPILEGFVASELRRLAGWSRVRPRLLHFRSHGGREVDLVLEDARGRLVGVEVKATASPDPRDTAGLRALAEALPRRFHRGILLTTAREPVAYGPRLHALPISALWSLGR